MALTPKNLRLLEEAIGALSEGFAHLPEFDAGDDCDALRNVLQAVARRLQENDPYYHPLYVGQMLKPPHPVAHLAYALALELNPNNHALDGGRASSQMEREAVAAMARFVGWDQHLGHLASGGTIANFEALWVARELAPGRAIVASTQAHYTHARLASVLGVPFHPIDVDSRGRMDVAALRNVLEAQDVGTVVATAGTTGAGAVDPVVAIAALREEFGFRLHVDAAYGGYFRLVDGLQQSTRQSLDALPLADSIVIDPHKHGLQPYGCGCVLFRDPAVGRIFQHDSPYTYFTSAELHLGQISLECSRPGAAAVALWTTLQLLPLKPGGEFARMLVQGRSAALELYEHLEQDDRFVPLLEPELDIVVWAMRAESASESSRSAERVYHAARQRDLYLAMAKVPREMLMTVAPVGRWDAEEITCLRACVMKPEHESWLPEIWKRLSEC